MRTLSLGLTAAGMVFALTACGGDKDETASDSGTTDTVPTGGTTATGDSGPPPSNGVATMTMDLYLGIGADGMTRTVDWGGYDQGSMLILNFGTASWTGDSAATTQYCSVIYFLDGRTNTLTSPDSGFWFGVANVDVNDAVSSCEDFDSEFSADYITDFGAVAWDIFLGGPVDSEIADNFDPITDYYGGEMGGELFADNFAIAGVHLEAPGGVVTVDDAGTGTIIPAGAVQGQTGMVEGLAIGVVPWIFNF